MSIIIQSPLAGTVVSAAQVPDPVFSTGMLGTGLAIDPDRAAGEVTVLAPITGTVDKAHPHAFVVSDGAGHSVLVHLGLDTVQLGAEGFRMHVAEGEAVAAGDPVVTWCPAGVEAGGRNPIVPVVALQADALQIIPSPEGTRISAGQALMTWN
ncbi:PTS sugar transporter subunit IIA [Actinomyces qiguomingii]|uniref:PTS sugar transporter subunit IIA n=1 Tax=Actinomyces qiguomingii TaxID=2057800 RepID=UPI000CA04EB9|nr:PTS glucose transporter subunit IIA [Actinomyces qiguomingii]